MCALSRVENFRLMLASVYRLISEDRILLANNGKHIMHATDIDNSVLMLVLLTWFVIAVNRYSAAVDVKQNDVTQYWLIQLKNLT